MTHTKRKITTVNYQISRWFYVGSIFLSLFPSHREPSKGQTHNLKHYIISIVLTTITTICHNTISNAAPLVSVDKIRNCGYKISDRSCRKFHWQLTHTQLKQSNALTNTIFGNLDRQNHSIDRYTNVINFEPEIDSFFAPSVLDIRKSNLIPCKYNKINSQNPCVSLPLKVSQADTQSISQSNPEPNNPPTNEQQGDPPPLEGEPNLPTSSPTEAPPLTEPQRTESEDKIERLRRSLKSSSQRELGTLRVREVNNRNTGKTPQSSSQGELGRLRVREANNRNTEKTQSPIEQIPPPATKKPVKRQPTPAGYLIGYFGYFTSTNIFSSEVDPIGDGLFYSGLTLASAPLRFGKNTSLNASVDGYLIRYINQSEFDYNQIRFNLNLYQKLAPQTYAGIGWTHQNLFYARDSDFFASGDRFLSENSFRFSLSRRDLIAPKLSLDSVYEFRYNFADPDSRNRVINSLWLSMNYRWQPLQVGLNYQFNFSDFTKRDREDNFHRLYANLNYSVSKTSQISVQSGIVLGGSTDPRIDFDGWFIGVNYSLELGRF
ncbi:MAG: hypothetical protein QNJ63_02020 [Calothrix sp. MO_192.B10]|nr:hypothetical protein [Calothrix sp. MO_192.B10]